VRSRTFVAYIFTTHFTQNQMKKYTSAILQSTFIIAAIIGATSCMNNKSEDTKEVAEEKSQLKYQNNEKDAQFLIDAAEINLIEISLGQLAQQKGSSSHVRELGKMMEDGHTKALTDLTILAQTKNIILPTSQTEKGKDAYKNLNNKSGNDFGKEYSSMAVNGHKKAIELFEKASTDCTDADIRAWASASLLSLKIHLEQALICQKQCDKM
jgi:putative membrane protein